MPPSSALLTDLIIDSNEKPLYIHSKSMFFFLMILFSFTERGQGEQVAPVLTVPTN